MRAFAKRSTGRPESGPTRGLAVGQAIYVRSVGSPNERERESPKRSGGWLLVKPCENRSQAEEQSDEHSQTRQRDRGEVGAERSKGRPRAKLAARRASLPAIGRAQRGFAASERGVNGPLRSDGRPVAHASQQQKRGGTPRRVVGGL